MSAFRLSPLLLAFLAGLLASCGSGDATPATPTPVPTPAPSFTSDEAVAAVKQYVRDQRDPALPSSVSRLQLSLLAGREFTSLARWNGTEGRWRVTVDRESFWFHEATEVVEYIAPTPTPRP